MRESLYVKEMETVSVREREKRKIVCIKKRGRVRERKKHPIFAMNICNKCKLSMRLLIGKQYIQKQTFKNVLFNATLMEKKAVIFIVELLMCGSFPRSIFCKELGFMK